MPIPFDLPWHSIAGTASSRTSAASALLFSGMRERLLEALSRRFAHARDADAYAVRGGMAIRSWIPDRVARDLDLVCRLPYRVRDLTARLGEILALPVNDGVIFDEEFRVDPYVGSPKPGLQLFARSNVGDLSADIAFELEVRPIRHAEQWMCPHEMVIATKLNVLGELGPRSWRTKDLGDLWQLLRRFPANHRLGEAFERFTRDREILAAPWWREPATAMRWARYVAKHPSMPDLDTVVSEVRAQLSPFARQS